MHFSKMRAMGADGALRRRRVGHHPAGTGYSCGTRAALDKHLARFPGDPAHAAQIKEVSAKKMQNKIK